MSAFIVPDPRGSYQLALGSHMALWVWARWPFLQALKYALFSFALWLFLDFLAALWRWYRDPTFDHRG